ncbi:MAG TPA: SDR family oxidoreductase [Pyrinomonadaceae bacterium]|jgi:NAD(P)-dependent dehydrogenase (short-subunit alcohol dehydrogenase family)
MKLKPINEQVVVITGASSGIGRAAALDFGKLGAKVVAAARDELGLQSLVEEIRADGGEAIFKVCDVADFSQVTEVAQAAVERFGRIDTWVNNAAVLLFAKFEDTTTDEFRRLMEVNFMGQVHGCKAALPFLRQAGGALICVSSVESEISMPLHSAYAASKHAVAGFLDALRIELLNEGAAISVTNIRPASINTPLFNNARSKMGVKGKGAPPIYSPQIVADAIVQAAQKPFRDLIVGGSGKMMISGQKYAPGLMDLLLSKIGFSQQKTNEPKSETAPDNLFEPTRDDRVEGDMVEQSKSVSAYTFVETRPVASALIAAGALGGAALLYRSLRKGSKATNVDGGMSADGLSADGLSADGDGMSDGKMSDGRMSAADNLSGDGQTADAVVEFVVVEAVEI